MIGSHFSLKVIALGRFSLLRNQKVVSEGNWKQRRVRELFKVLLSAEHHRLHREQAQEILWPSSSLEQAANSFSKTLYLLRRALEPDLVAGKSSSYIFLDQDTLLLAPDSIQIDVDLFETMAKQIQGILQGTTIQVQDIEKTLETIDQTLALYGGDYLPDDLYEDWTQRKRDRLRYIYTRILEHAATVAITGAQGQRACEYLRALLEQNTTDEQTHRQLMLVYARMGRRSEALNLYHSLREILREELRANPLPETIELYRKIQNGQISADLTETRQAPIHLLTQETSEAPPHTYTHTASDAHATPTATIISPGPGNTPKAAQATVTTPKHLEPGRIRNAELVGRSEELQRLRQADGIVRAGLPCVFFISGEAGIGKTRLAREFSLSIQAQQQATVLWGNCYEMSGALPYQPIIDMLTADLRLKEPDQLRSILGNSAADLAKLLPVLHTKLPDLPILEPLGLEAERRNLYNAVTNYFHTVASERLLILILDDLQWADTATMQLLAFLLAYGANQIQQQQMLPLFLLLYRPDEVRETHPLRSLLSTQTRRGYAQEIRLKRLQADEVQQLLTQMAGHAIHTSFTEEIYQHTEGNPFFIGETIRALIERGKLKKVEERWQTTVTPEELELPQSVRLIIERRLTHLSPECRVTLAYAAAIGREIHSALLCRARNLAEEIIAEHIDEAIHAQILETIKGTTRCIENECAAKQDADLLFTHDKLREVLALWPNPLRRRIIHRQVAQAIEERYSSHLHTYHSKLAYHYQIAEDIPQAVEHLKQAAAQATQVYAFFDAANLMENAVELLLSDENKSQRAELLRKLSVEAYLYIGRPDKAIETGLAAAALWRELGNPAKEAESHLDVSFSFHWMGRETAANDSIKHALACLEHIPQETRLLAKAYVQWGLCATVSGNIPEALEKLRIADELHNKIGGNDPFISVVSLWAHSWCAFTSGTLQQMLDKAQHSAELCRATHMFAWEPMMIYSVAWALMLMGKLEEGANVAHETLEKAQQHNVVGAQGWAYLVLSFIAVLQKQWDTARHFENEAAEIAVMMNEKDLLARVFWGRSIHAGWQGEWEKAVEHSLEAIEILQRNGEHSLAYPYLLLQVAKALFHAGKLEDAQHYLDQTIQLAQEHHYQQLPAICHRLEGRIMQAQGDFEQAQNHFEQSLTQLALLNDTVEYARTQEAYALFFRARGNTNDLKQAAELHQQAHTLFESLGIHG
jgi:DNA-binding SARP family transcriptional activator